MVDAARGEPLTPHAVKQARQNDKVFWVSVYHIAVDAILGLPVWEGSRSKVPWSKSIQEISQEKASEINAIFAAESPQSSEYLAEQLAARWKVIGRQVAGLDG